jgi:hypothetical protein
LIFDWIQFLISVKCACILNHNSPIRFEKEPIILAILL